VLGTLAELQAELGGRVVGDGSVRVERVTGVDETGAGALTFATDAHFLAAALKSAAAAVLVDASVPLEGDVSAKPLLVVENARAALALLLAKLKPPRPRGPFRHPTAVVEEGAEIGEDVYLGPHCYVGPNARLGARVALGAGAFVGPGAEIGEETFLHPHAVVHDRCVVGRRVVLHSGAVIGSEGFGWAFIEGRLERIPQVGNVVLGDEVEIGANSCVDRAQTGSTTIGRGTKIDNLVQIGHNCRIGMHCAIAAECGLAGSTSIGDYVKMAGQAGTRGHMHIGSRATIAGQSGVWGDVAEGATVSGNPARDHRETLRAEVMLRKLPKLIARVDALEKKPDSGTS
jgi:UDP-3-O-[3-hydroxymyristoyl] glucosamine N-acyltransferase